MVQKQTDKIDPFSRISRITPRERECLELVVQRKGSKEIAAILGISPHTVDARIKSAMRKLDATSRDMAALIFIESERLGHGVTVTSDHANLVSQSPDLAPAAPSANKAVSAGEGDSLGGLGQSGSQHPVSSHDYRRGESLPELSQLIAAFNGAVNHTPKRQRSFIMFTGIAIILLAFGLVASGLAGLSSVISSP